MSFLELVKVRQSVREYSNVPIEREKIDRCLEAARLSPSACNSQPWSFIIVNTPKLRDKIARSTFNDLVSFNKFSLNAPILVVVTATKGNLKTKVGQIITSIPYYLIDIGIAAEHFCLQAAEEGLGTCMIGWFNEKKIKKHLSIGKDQMITLIIAVGYPKSTSIRNKNRKPISEISTFNLTDL